MIKKTLYFGNPAYLALRNDQLVIKLPEIGKNDSLPDTFRQQSQVTKPIEDIGVVVLDNKQITITSGALEALLENNCAVITCDSKSMPVGLMLPLYGNTTQNERFRQQLSASVPLMKQLWQQTIKAKIYNQAFLLDACTNEENKCMKIWATEVKSGDSDNLEARAVVARALVSSGLLPTLGIHHHNRYNAYCLADDIMEPYRPYVDQLVYNMIQTNPDYQELNKSIKAQLLSVPTLEVVIAGKRSPLMVAVSQTTASLYKCFSGELRRIAYPEMQ